MKTSVSIPEDLFRKAEVAARKLRMSRSHLYARAIREFLDRRMAGDDITARLNKIYSTESSKLDPALDYAQLRSVKSDCW